MKIEKISDTQIRCTLTKEDLSSREIKLSELAYGSEKAKSLFRDMMQQAAYEFGFVAEDIPIMIEAVPVNADCIILTITKVEDPEELDTRFSKFAPSVHELEQQEDLIYPADDPLPFGDFTKNQFDQVQNAPKENPFGKILESAPLAAEKSDTAKSSSLPVEIPEVVFYFSTMEPLIQLSSIIANIFPGETMLFKTKEPHGYLLYLSIAGIAGDILRPTLYSLCEYGKFCRNTAWNLAYLEEHFEKLLSADAIQNLAKLN